MNCVLDEAKTKKVREALEFHVQVEWSDAGARCSLPKRVRATLLGDARRPLLVVLGGISATADVVSTPKAEPGWWSELFTERRFNPEAWRILSFDYAADWRGAFAPSPFDQAEALHAIITALGAKEPAAIIGASYGGMVAMSYAQRFQPNATRLLIISADDVPHPYSTAQRELQRRVVQLGIASDCAPEALNIARGLGMITYRSPEEFEQRFDGGKIDGVISNLSKPGEYLRSRGGAFLERMAPTRFLSLSASIDRQRIDVSMLRQRCRLLAVPTDQLIPFSNLREMASQWGGPCEFRELPSLYGHDGFLKEPDAVAANAREFLGDLIDERS